MQINKDVFSYEVPTKIIYGKNSTELIGEEVKELGINNILITTDKGIKEAGVLESILASLDKENINYYIYDEVKADSGVDIVNEATKVAKDNNCELIMGVGGGSSLDTAKAVAVMVTNPGNNVLDYAGLDEIENDPVKIFAVPTTAGTGSEATIWAVISNKNNNIKTGVGSMKMMPDVAICDPLLTKSLPANITAATGMDALTHAIESYVNTATQPISEAMAEKSISLISNNLRQAVANGDNLEARDSLLMGSLLAAFAFNETRLGIAHSISSPLGAFYPIPHGVANAILLPNVMEFNLIGNPGKYKKVAELMGENTSGLNQMEAAKKSVEAVSKLMKDIGIPRKLSEVADIDQDDIPKIVDQSYQSGNNLVNPRKPSKDDLLKVINNSL